MPPKKSDPIVGLTKDTLDDMINRAVQAAVGTLAASLTDDLHVYFDNKFQEYSESQDNLKAEICELKNRVSTLENKVDSLTNQLRQQSNLIDCQEKRTNEVMRWAYNNEQYSRRENIKIHGLQVKDDEDCRLKVINLLKKDLGIKIKNEDISVAHPVPRKIQKNNVDGEPLPNPIIVKFSPLARERRDETIKKRRQLKGSGVVIFEDLTDLNAKLINWLTKNDDLKNVWSVNGKVFGLAKTGKKIRFEPFDNVEEKLANIK